MAITDKAKFDFVRYANVWEDATVLAKALQIQKGEKLLSIASAGDNCFYLLKDDPEIAVAVDLSEVQLYLVELKKTAIRILDYEDVLALFGFRESNKRNDLYQKIKSGIPSEARAYWDTKAEVIKEGLLHDGKFEKYFQTFSQKVLPYIHSKEKTTELFKNKSAAAQKEFYDKKWNTWRWRLLFKVFFSKRIMGWLGRDPEFLKQVEINVGNFIFNQAEKQLSSEKAHSNHMLRYNLTSSFDDLLPEYLQKEHYATIKNNIDNVHCFKGYAQEASKKYGNFDVMNLSNIFEYMDQKIFRESGQAFIDIANPGARIAYWNLMVPRRLSKEFNQLTFLESLSNDLMQEDKGFYYSQFVVEKLNE